MTSRFLAHFKSEHLFFPSARWTDQPAINDETARRRATSQKSPPLAAEELTTSTGISIREKPLKNITQFLSLLIDLDFPYYLSASDLVNFSFSCKAAVPFLRRVRLLSRWTEEIQKAMHAGAFKHLQEVNLAGLGLGCAGKCRVFFFKYRYETSVKKKK